MLGQQGKVLADRNVSAADAFARAVAPKVRALRVDYSTIGGFAAALNAAGVRTRSLSRRPFARLGRSINIQRSNDLRSGYLFDSTHQDQCVG